MAAPADGNCKKDKVARYLDGAQPSFSVAIVGDGLGLIRQHCGDLVVWVDGSFPPHILPFGALLAIRNSCHLFSAEFVHAA